MIFAVTQKSVSTSTKYLGTSYKRVEIPTKNELATSQLEIMEGMTQVIRQCLEKKTAIPVQELAEGVFGKMAALELKQIPQHKNPSQA